MSKRNRSVLTGKLSDRANIHNGNTRATTTATLAVINILKERRRGRFVAVGGTEPRRAAYRGSVQDDEKTNAVEANEMVKKTVVTSIRGQHLTDSLPKDAKIVPMKTCGRSPFYASM